MKRAGMRTQRFLLKGHDKDGKEVQEVVTVPAKRYVKVADLVKKCRRKIVTSITVALPGVGNLWDGLPPATVKDIIDLNGLEIPPMKGKLVGMVKGLRPLYGKPFETDTLLNVALTAAAELDGVRGDLAACKKLVTQLLLDREQLRRRLAGAQQLLVRYTQQRRKAKRRESVVERATRENMDRRAR